MTNCLITPWVTDLCTNSSANLQVRRPDGHFSVDLGGSTDLHITVHSEGLRHLHEGRERGERRLGLQPDRSLSLTEKNGMTMKLSIFSTKSKRLFEFFRTFQWEVFFSTKSYRNHNGCLEFDGQRQTQLRGDGQFGVGGHEGLAVVDGQGALGEASQLGGLEVSLADSSEDGLRGQRHEADLVAKNLQVS